jgi:hypothetical protein
MFIVLLVILSMLNAAAEVVFVNKVRPLQPLLDETSASLDAARAQESADRVATERAQAAYNTEVTSHADDHKADVGVINTMQRQLNDANVQITQLQADKTRADSAFSQLNGNLTMQTTASTSLQKNLEAVRTANDGLVRHAEEMSRSIADLSNKSDTLQSELNNAKVNLAAMKEKYDKLAGLARDGGVNPNKVAEPGPGPTALAISGTVLEKQVINGNTYLRVNVGKEDGVSNGTQFNVLDGPNFLGILTIDSADSHDASGRLVAEPAKMGQVRQGNTVKTQLRGS